jgi:hypothetical protein
LVDHVGAHLRSAQPFHSVKPGGVLGVKAHFFDESIDQDEGRPKAALLKGLPQKKRVDEANRRARFWRGKNT